MITATVSASVGQPPASTEAASQEGVPDNDAYLDVHAAGANALIVTLQRLLASHRLYATHMISAAVGVVDAAQLRRDVPSLSQDHFDHCMRVHEYLLAMPPNKVIDEPLAPGSVWIHDFSANNADQLTPDMLGYSTSAIMKFSSFIQTEVALAGEL